MKSETTQQMRSFAKQNFYVYSNKTNLYSRFRSARNFKCSYESESYNPNPSQVLGMKYWKQTGDFEITIFFA